MKYKEYLENLKTEMLSRLDFSLAGLNKIKETIKEVKETDTFYFGYDHYSESYLYSTFYSKYESEITRKFGRIVGLNSYNCRGESDLTEFIERIDQINLIENLKRQINVNYKFLNETYAFEIKDYNIRYYGLTSLCSILKYIFDDKEVLSDNIIESLNLIYQSDDNTFIFSLTENKECLIRFYKNGKTIIKFETLEDLNQFVKALES